MSSKSLYNLEKQAISFLRAVADFTPDVELCYSGGKDSDVILHLARVAGIPFTAIYKNTTIDPPGTLKHCIDNGVQILQPQSTFFDLIEHKGFPTRRARFCCSELKEYKIKDYAILGIRAEESTAREKRYIEPDMCRVYSKNSKVAQFFPLLYWNKDDILEYVVQNKIKLHPLYYREDGTIDITKRLGCIGCPLQSDCGKADFKHYKKFLRQYINHGHVWWNTHPHTRSHEKFSDIYALFAHNLFFSSYDEFMRADAGIFGKENWKQRLEDYFETNLP